MWRWIMMAVIMAGAIQATGCVEERVIHDGSVQSRFGQSEIPATPNQPHGWQGGGVQPGGTGGN